MKYQIFATEYWPIKNQNRWSEIVSGTVCVIALWLTSDELVYLLVSCPKFQTNSDATDGLSRALGPNLITRLKETFWLN